MVKGITKEEFDKLQPRCGCLCNKLITWKEHYKYNGVPKFIKGHYLPFIQKGNPSFFKGKKHSIESRLKSSESHKRCCGQKNSFYGRKHTNITKQKMSEKAKQRTSEENPAWIDGRSFLPYCEKFNEPLKEAVRERDSRICQLCSSKEINRKNSVHHIHYDKENCYPDLITLCISCNSKVNKNRDFWEELFTFMLWIRGMLYWKPL